MSARLNAWALLLERLPLRETLDALRGYAYPSQACEVLCKKHGLTGPELDSILKLHRRLYQGPQGGGARGRPCGPKYRDGFDLLFDIAPLRLELAKTPFETLLNQSALRRLQVLFELRPLELGRVLNAHAEMLARP